MTKKRPVFNMDKIRGLAGATSKDSMITHDFVNELLPILKELELNKKENSIQDQLKKYCIVRSVSLIEKHLRDLVVKIIDEHGVEIRGLFDSGEISIPLENFEEIKDKDFTRGRIVSSNFNFQNPDDIDLVLSKLLRTNFLATMKSYIMKINNAYTQFEPSKYLLEDWKLFFQVFNSRNNIVHSLHPEIELPTDFDYYFRIYLESQIFVILCWTITGDILHFKKGTLKDRDLLIFYNSELKNYQK